MSTDSSEEEQIQDSDDRKLFDLPIWLTAVIPILLLFLIVAGFLVANPLGDIQSGEPLPDISISYVEIPNSEVIAVNVINNGPKPVTISQVLVDEAYWGFRIEGTGGDHTLEPMETAKILIPYHITPGFDYDINLITESGVTFHHTIVAAHETPGFNFDLLWIFALIGVFVGLIPVLLGMMWYPAMQKMKDRSLHAVLAFSAGILAFLVFDAGFESFEFAAEAPSAYNGALLVILGILGALVLVQAVMDRIDTGESRGLVVAYGVAFGIGLHNLAEGLAIGSTYALGRVSLGAFLIIGFMVHNVTEGPAIVAPVARGERPWLGHFVGMGALAGLPTILGGWIGALAFSPTLGAFFLAVGVGALLQVIFDITGIIRDAGELLTASNLVGFLAGFIVMYLTEFLVVV